MPGGTPVADSDPACGSTTSSTSRYSPGVVGPVWATSRSADVPGPRPAGSNETAVEADGVAPAAPPARSTHRATIIARVAGVASPIGVWMEDAGCPHTVAPRFVTRTASKNGVPADAVA